MYEALSGFTYRTAEIWDPKHITVLYYLDGTNMFDQVDVTGHKLSFMATTSCNLMNYICSAIDLF